MFKRITIRLTEPICLCLERKLAWNVVQAEKGPELNIWCKECGVTLHIPHDKFRAGWELDQEYPGKPEEKPEPVSLKPGDVIDFAEHLRRKQEQDSHS